MTEWMNISKNMRTLTYEHAHQNTDRRISHADIGHGRTA
jgi:hypothetical protein